MSLSFVIKFTRQSELITTGTGSETAGTVAARFFLENGEQKHAKDFEAAKEQCRIDNHGQNVNT